MLRVLAALLPVVLVVSIVLARRWTDWVPHGEIVQLTSARSFDGLPSLSPEGDWIAYRSDAAGNGDILLSRIDGWQTVRYDCPTCFRSSRCHVRRATAC